MCWFNFTFKSHPPTIILMDATKIKMLSHLHCFFLLLLFFVVFLCTSCLCAAFVGAIIFPLVC